jgi:hypothetical protein
MLSLFTTVPLSLVSSFIFNPYFWIGYVVCVLIPIPFVNSTIIGLWSKFGSGIVSAFKSLTSSAEASVENSVVSVENTVVTTNVIVSTI